jgi:hypothetical protein
MILISIDCLYGKLKLHLRTSKFYNHHYHIYSSLLRKQLLYVKVTSNFVAMKENKINKTP